MRHKLYAWTLLIAVGFGLTACASVGEESVVDPSVAAAVPPADPVALNIDIANKVQYLAEEAMDIKVTLTNNTEETKVLPALSAHSLVFYFGKVDTAELMQRPPVASELEPPAGPVEIAPHTSVDRHFL